MLSYLRQTVLSRFLSTSQSVHKVNVYLALWFTLAYNIPFLVDVNSNISGAYIETTLLVCTLAFCIFLINYLVVLFLSVKQIFKPSIICLLLICSILFYSNISGKQYNPSAFNISEWLAGVGRFLSWAFIANILVLFALPTAILLKTEIKWESLRVHTIKVVAVIALTSLTLISIYKLAETAVAPYYQETRHYLAKVIPAHFIDSSLKYLHHQYFEPSPIFTILDKTPHAIDPSKHKTLVLILGESVRADSFNQYFQTTGNEQNFQKGTIAACNTFPESSIQCIFSFLGTTMFDEHLATHQQNVLDILSLSGVQIHWIARKDGCGTICSRAKVRSYLSSCKSKPCFDDHLIDDTLKSILDDPSTPSRSNLIVIQTENIASPLYSRHYPRQFATHTPECNTLLVANCDKTSIMNSYQNAIEFLQSVLLKADKTLSKYNDRHPQVMTSLIFSSKFGESLGENGRYFHAAPKAIAPPEQLLVPLIMKDKHLPSNCLSSIENELNHDVIAHTLLGYFNITTKTYSSRLDIAKLCEYQT